MAIEYFCCYHSYLEALEQLDDAERGRLFTACLIYSKTGVAPELKGNERFVFPTFRCQIDRDANKYNERCRKQAENARKRWDAMASKSIPHDTNDAEYAKEKTKTKAKTKEKEKEKAKDICTPQSPPKGARFTKPSLEDVIGYCQERGGKVDPYRFYDYYEANGWRVGKNPMKDWRAAVRNWERQESGPPKQEKRDTGFRTSNPFLEMLEEEYG